MTAFKQPVHVDRWVPLDVQEPCEPVAEMKTLTIEGFDGRVVRMALDGRVLIELANKAREVDFAQRFRKLGAMCQEAERGVWVDLAKFAYDWHS